MKTESLCGLGRRGRGANVHTVKVDAVVIEGLVMRVGGGCYKGVPPNQSHP